jgi:hypothetical protein
MEEKVTRTLGQDDCQQLIGYPFSGRRLIECLSKVSSRAGYRSQRSR